MNEKELGKMLLAGNGPTDVAALTARVLARDRRRIWLLGVGCVIAWMAVVMLPWATVLPMMAKVVEHQKAVAASPAATTPAATGTVHEHSIEVLQALKFGTIATFIGSIASMFVAAIFTVSMIVVSRRATLRQVNARLAEISAHLQELGRAGR
jgi:hypothetical protein